MAKKYLLVEISKTAIKEVRKVSESELRDALGSKKHNQHVLEVKSYKSAREEIGKHNPTDRTPIKEVKYNKWDWTKQSERNKKKIVELYDIEEWGALMGLLNKCKISKSFFCCNSYIPEIKTEIDKYKTGI